MQFTEPQRRGRVSELIQMLDHRLLKRLANLHAVKAQRPDAAHRIAQPLRLDFERHEPPIETLVRERLFDQVMRRIAGHRIGDQAAFFDERGAGHGKIRLFMP